MEIEYLPGDLADAVETVRSRLKNFYQDVSEENQDAHSSMGIGWLPGAEHYFRGTNGTDWNSAQQETWLLPCYEDGGQTGVFAAQAVLDGDNGAFRHLVMVLLVPAPNGVIAVDAGYADIGVHILARANNLRARGQLGHTWTGSSFQTVENIPHDVFRERPPRGPLPPRLDSPICALFRGELFSLLKFIRFAYWRNHYFIWRNYLT